MATVKNNVTTYALDDAESAELFAKTNSGGIKVEEIEGLIYVSLEEFLLRIDPTKKSFYLGEYAE